MRIFPLLLIGVGVFGVLQRLGLIDPSFVHWFWPLLLIAIGVALLTAGPRWRANMRGRTRDRWERRMHRHFGPGWANLSEEERERFRAGMQQWNLHRRGEGIRPATAPASDGPYPGSAPPRAPDDLP